MSDNIESRMNFIIEQQAQFTVDIQLLKERQAETREMIRQLVDVTMSLGTAKKPIAAASSGPALTNSFANARKRGRTPIVGWTR